MFCNVTTVFTCLFEGMLFSESKGLALSKTLATDSVFLWRSEYY